MIVRRHRPAPRPGSSGASSSGADRANIAMFSAAVIGSRAKSW